LLRRAQNEIRNKHVLTEVRNRLRSIAPEHSWSDKNRRQRGAAAVMQALEHEKRAVEIVQKAITAL